VVDGGVSISAAYAKGSVFAASDGRHRSVSSASERKDSNQAADGALEAATSDSGGGAGAVTAAGKRRGAGTYREGQDSNPPGVHLVPGRGAQWF
jgi:hypothetical protein